MSKTKAILQMMKMLANELDSPIMVLTAGETMAAGAIEYMTDEETAKEFCEEMKKGLDKCLRDYAKKKEKT